MPKRANGDEKAGDAALVTVNVLLYALARPPCLVEAVSPFRHLFTIHLSLLILVQIKHDNKLKEYHRDHFSPAPQFISNCQSV